MRPTLLLDADILVYQSAAVHQRVTDWGDDTVTVTTDSLEEAINTIQNAVDQFQQTLKAGRIVFCLSDSDNFRKALLPTYKANRPVKPVLVAPLKEWLRANTRCYQKPTLEGDDVLGILATHPTLIKGPKIMVSIDKDMKTIPGTIYNPGRDTLDTVSPEEADYWHMFQTITGDPTDNYKGCPGVGPKGADKALQEAVDQGRPLWEAVVDTYARKGLTEGDALVQARVARILRHTDYNFKTKEPRLWEPPH